MVARSLPSVLLVLATSSALWAGEPTQTFNVVNPFSGAVSHTRFAGGPTRDVFLCLGSGTVTAQIFDVNSSGMKYQFQSLGLLTGSGFPVMGNFTSPHLQQFQFDVALVAIVVLDVTPVLPPPPNQTPAYTVLAGYNPPPRTRR